MTGEGVEIQSVGQPAEGEEYRGFGFAAPVLKCRGATPAEADAVASGAITAVLAACEAVEGIEIASEGEAIQGLAESLGVRASRMGVTVPQLLEGVRKFAATTGTTPPPQRPDADGEAARIRRRLEDQGWKCASASCRHGRLGTIYPGERLALAYDGHGLLHLDCAMVAVAPERER